MARKRKYVFGFLLVIVGALLLARSTNLFFFSFNDVLDTALPLVLIVLGGWLILRKRHETATRVFDGRPSDQPAAGQPCGPPPPPPPPGPEVRSSTKTGYGTDASGPARAESPEGGEQPSFQSETYESRQQWQTSEGPQIDSTGKLKYSRVFGDMHIDLNGIKMQCVEVSSGIGDVHMKLAGGELTKGLNRIIISTFVGDVRIFVPRDMAVFAHCSNFVGDIELEGRRASGFGNNVDSRTPNYDAAERKLYIACSTFIGDVMITPI